MKKALVLMANGFEDVEAVTPIDYLRRAGIEVTTVSILDDSLTVTSRWGGIKLITDTSLTELLNRQNDWDAVIIPGGMPGASNLAASEETNTLIKKMAAAGKLVCAICAAPVIVLYPLGILNGKKFTCYPGMEEKAPDGIWSGDSVVADGNIITSRSAGTAGHFAIKIIEKLLDEPTAKQISESLLL